MTRSASRLPAPEIPHHLEWLNLAEPLALAALRGRVVLLHFWAGSSINSLHTLKELQAMAEEFRSQIAVVGVYCGKFTAEGPLHQVRQEVMRHGVEHPVVNDPEFQVWRCYGIEAWPSLVVIDQTGSIVGAHRGEFTAEALQPLLARLCRESGPPPLPMPALSPEVTRQPLTELFFPAGIAALPGGLLAVSDSANHQIVLIEPATGTIRGRIGSGRPGLQDGSPAAARFDDPRGLCCAGGRLLVADRGNHAVRAVAPETGYVETIRLSAEGNELDLRSPVALCALDEQIFAASSGSHRIISFRLRQGRLSPVAGDGFEGLLDGDPARSRLGQPCSLALQGDRLWWLDAATSSIRSLGLRAGGRVETHTGGGLFAWGSTDGTGDEALMQFPTGLACAGDVLIIADSYNNRIRTYDPKSGQLSTLAGTGEPGLFDSLFEDACFWMPGPMTAVGDAVWLVDIQNHAVRRLDLAEGAVSTLALTH